MLRWPALTRFKWFGHAALLCWAGALAAFYEDGRTLGAVRSLDPPCGVIAQLRGSVSNPVAAC